MLFLCFADFHGVMPDKLKICHKPEALLFLGDMNGVLRRVLIQFPDIPAFGVAGNHDTNEPFSNLNVEDLHGRAIVWNGIRLGGLGGSLRYKPGGKWLFWDKDYEKVLSTMPPVDIFVSHCPPAGVPGCMQKSTDDFHDSHEGSEALRRYIERTKPKVLLHGHLHGSGVTRIGDTLVRGIYGMEYLDFCFAVGQ